MIGFLSSASAAGYANRVTAFKQGLGQHGYMEGRNVAIEYRWAEDQSEKLPQLAADLVRNQASLIVAMGGSLTASIAKSATTTIPIVFMHGSDPVRLGHVASLNRPGGNVTGVTAITVETMQKRLEILRELLPKQDAFAVLIYRGNPNLETYSKDAEAAARVLNIRVDVLAVKDADNVELDSCGSCAQACRWHRIHGRSTFREQSRAPC